jgi:hypothetical protein
MDQMADASAAAAIRMVVMATFQVKESSSSKTIWKDLAERYQRDHDITEL